MNALVRARVLADDALLQPLDDGADPGRAEALVELAPADDAVRGRQLQEVVVPPPGIAMQGLDRADLHRLASRTLRQLSLSRREAYRSSVSARAPAGRWAGGRNRSAA